MYTYISQKTNLWELRVVSTILKGWTVFRHLLTEASTAHWAKERKRDHGNNTAVLDVLDACQAMWHTWVSSALLHPAGHHKGCFYREEKAQRGSQHPQGHTAAEPEGGSTGRRPAGQSWLTEKLGAQNCVLKSPTLLPLTRPQGWKNAILPGDTVVKNPLAKRYPRDVGLIPESGRFPGGGNGNPPGAWRATVHGVTKSRTRLSDRTRTRQNTGRFST